MLCFYVPWSGNMESDAFLWLIVMNSDTSFRFRSNIWFIFCRSIENRLLTVRNWWWTDDVTGRRMIIFQGIIVLPLSKAHWESWKKWSFGTTLLHSSVMHLIGNAQVHSEDKFNRGLGKFCRLYIWLFLGCFFWCLLYVI